jgi:hypothetical protein
MPCKGAPVVYKWVAKHNKRIKLTLATVGASGTIGTRYSNYSHDSVEITVTTREIQIKISLYCISTYKQFRKGHYSVIKWDVDFNKQIIDSDLEIKKRQNGHEMGRMRTSYFTDIVNKKNNFAKINYISSLSKKYIWKKWRLAKPKLLTMSNARQASCSFWARAVHTQGQYHQLI